MQGQSGALAANCTRAAQLTTPCLCAKTAALRPALAPSTAASTRRMLLVHSLTLRPTSSSSLSFSLSVSCPAGEQSRVLSACFGAVRHLQCCECP